jgi:hypothetical protein
MKTPGRVSEEPVFSVEEAAEGGFTARALEESSFTEADDVTSFHDRVREAVRCHFEADRIPRGFRLRVVREEVVTS